ARVEAAGLDSLCTHSEGFPSALEQLDDPPVVIYVGAGPGRLGELLEEPSVAVVGARKASPYGLEIAEEIGRGLSAAGVAVVSGLALGIDGASHRGALARGGRAIAVLGCGADVPYPARHRDLYRRVRAEGAVISELPPGTPPFKWSFPARNRIMAALAEVTVVVEAARASGSLITADFALDLGRGVAAVPGLVTARMAAGSNQLLRDGAAFVRGPADVLGALYGSEQPAEPEEPQLDTALRAVLDAVESGESPARAASTAGMPASAVRAALGRLEMMGLVRRDGFGYYIRSAVGA
ncbi:MAG: processing protein, partial [Thermoleophilaceae bacterium]|nr:processing protein [Thermoleophilaceae bacterium]